MEMSGLWGGLYRICEWIYRFTITNLLWFVCSIPFLFIILMSINAMSLEDLGPFYSSLILLAIAAPFTVFPANGGLFSVVRKWNMGEEDVPIVKTFFRGYKSNYLQSVMGGILFVLLLGLFVINYQFYSAMDNAMQLLSIVFLFLIAVLGVAVYYYTCLMVHVHMKTLTLLKNAFFLTIGRPLTSLMIALINFIGIYFSVFIYQVLIMLVTASFLGYATFYLFYRMFSKIQEQAEKAKEEELETANQ